MRSSSDGAAGRGGVGSGAARVATGVERDEVVAMDGGCIKMTGVTGVTGPEVVVLLSGVGVRLVVVSGVGVDADVSKLVVSSDEAKDEVEISVSSSKDSLSSGNIGTVRGDPQVPWTLIPLVPPVPSLCLKTRTQTLLATSHLNDEMTGRTWNSHYYSNA